MLSWLKKVDLPQLHTLKIRLKGNTDMSLLMVLDAVDHFQALETLRCPYLSIPVFDKTIEQLAFLC